MQNTNLKKKKYFAMLWIWCYEMGYSIFKLKTSEITYYGA